MFAAIVAIAGAGQIPNFAILIFKLHLIRLAAFYNGSSYI